MNGDDLPERPGQDDLRQGAFSGEDEGRPVLSARGEGDQTYEAAVARVEEIIRRLDSGEASLNETLELVREGKGLIEHCARELQDVSGALEELRLEDLVARLDSEVSTQ